MEGKENMPTSSQQTATYSPLLLPAPVIQDCYRTKMISEECSFTWFIEKFSLCGGQLGDRMTSPNFPFDKEKKCAWYLMICPTGDRESSDFVACYLHLDEAPEERIFTKVMFSLRDSDDRPIQDRNVQHVFRCHESWGWEKFIERDKLLAALPDDELRISVSVSAAVEIATFSEIISTEQKQEVKLMEDLATAFRNPKYSDVTVCVNNWELPAHQVILTARSKVFAAMFEHDTLEKNSKRVEIKDFNLETIEAMLYFIYTSRIPELNVPLATDLLKAADMYAIDDLKTLCSRYLISKLNHTNAVHNLILADTYNDLKLKAKALDFICKSMTASELEKYRYTVEQYPSILVDVLKKYML